MEELNALIERYQHDDRISQIITQIQSDTPTRLQLKGLVGAQECFVISGAYRADPRHHLIIAKDKEEAAYIQNSLANLFDKKTIHFLPDSFKHPTAFEQVNNNNILQRTEVTNRLTSGSSTGEIIVTYPEAVFEKVVAPEVLEANRISLVKGEDLDVDTLIDVLIKYGFERVDFVYEPGQFSIRGGIVDIFSYGNEWPYRVELFDEEIESIRTFHPATQLSQKMIASVAIVPNVETHISSDLKVSIFQILPEKMVIWVKDLQMIVDQLQVCFERASEFADSMVIDEDNDISKIIRERSFIKPKDVIQDLSNHKMIFMEMGDNILFVPTSEVTFHVTPQPSFNKNFGMLIDDLNAHTEKGYVNHIFADNGKQIERFYNIFQDQGANVQFHPIKTALHAGFIDHDLKIVCYTDHQIFTRFHKYRLKKGFTKDQALNLRMLKELQVGDFVTHMDHGVGRYSGLEKLEISGKTQESVRLIYHNNDVLYVGINSLHKITKYVGKEGTAPRLNKIGSDAWNTLKRKTKKKVKDIAKELIKLYAARKASTGHAFPPDGYLQNELEASFIYEDTPDQFTATQSVKEDMEKPFPMDRLICGDVGFGKTEIAIRAAFKAVTDGKQVAILVPTTILALQHYQTFKDRLTDFGADVDYVNRFRTAKEKKEIYRKAKEGKIDILIGTHAILNKDVGFKDLGLLIIDEEQKFGVAAKEKLRRFAVNVDTLTLTATPIPRTMQFSLMAARDMSVIRTAPPNRQPIHTERRVINDELIKDAIYYEVNRGGQVFFVHNRVKTLQDMTAMIKRLCPDVDVAMAHGQMDPGKLESTLVDFIKGKYEVLVCTNIIETGLDIANANTIIINNAHHFGLSDLHQLRGRVGRSNKKAYCYLFTPPISVLTPEARKRIQTVEEFSELGSGFNIAMRDMDIRGAGNLLGGEQSGFISDIGYETYQKILDEAIQELKETDFKDVFKEEIDKKKEYVRDVDIDVDLEMHIPTEYVSNVSERLSLYTEINKLKTLAEIEAFKKKMKDRFGPIPKAVNNLFKLLEINWICKQLGFERLIYKNRKLRCYFITNPQSPFYETEIFGRFMQFIAVKGGASGITMKKSNRYLIMVKDGVNSLSQVHDVLRLVDKEVNPSKEKAVT